MKIEDNNICFVRFFFASYEINCAKRMHNKMDGGWKKEREKDGGKEGGRRMGE